MATEAALFSRIDIEMLKEPRKGIWSEAIRTLMRAPSEPSLKIPTATTSTIFVEKEHASRAKGSLVQAMKKRKLRLRSQVKTLKSDQAIKYGIDPGDREDIPGIIFWAERVNKSE